MKRCALCFPEKLFGEKKEPKTARCDRRKFYQNNGSGVEGTTSLIINVYEVCQHLGEGGGEEFRNNFELFPKFF